MLSFFPLTPLFSYPSGNVAVMITAAEKGKFTYIVFDVSIQYNNVSMPKNERDICFIWEETKLTSFVSAIQAIKGK